MSTHDNDDDDFNLQGDDQAELRFAGLSRTERRAELKRLTAERLKSGTTKEREANVPPDLVHVDENGDRSLPPSMTPWRFTPPQERMQIMPLPVELLQPDGPGEASAELTGGDLDHQAALTGEASAELADEGLDALLWVQLGRGRRRR